MYVSPEQTQIAHMAPKAVCFRKYPALHTSHVNAFVVVDVLSLMHAVHCLSEVVVGAWLTHEPG
jgi:hypothetical protein